MRYAKAAVMVEQKNMRVAGAARAKPKHSYQSMHLAARLQDRFPLASLITHRFSIYHAAKALDLMKPGGTIKPGIDPTL